MTRRSQLRESEVGNARLLNEMLNSLQARIEALERVAYFDIRVTTDAAGNVSGITLTPPPWPAKSVSVAWAWNDTTKAPFSPARIGWQTTDNGLSVTLYVGDVSPSTTYRLRLEVRG